VRLVTVSVAAQKNGGELVQPIGSASRNATSFGALGVVGKTTLRIGMCLGIRKMW